MTKGQNCRRVIDNAVVKMKIQPLSARSTNFLIVSLLSCICFPGYGQTGPGGVGNKQKNVLWLNSESLFASNANRINFWHDESGNFNHAFAEMMHAPLLNHGNSWPQKSVLFTEAPGFLSIADDASLDGMNTITMFVVVKLTGGPGEQSVLSKSNGQGGINEVFAYRLLAAQSGAVSAEVSRAGNRLTAGENLSNSEYNIIAFRFDGNSNNRQLRIFKNGKEQGQRNTPQTPAIPDVDADLTLGALNAHAELPFRGQIAETIIYNQALNNAEMVVVENYLAAKYQIPVDSYYTQGLEHYRYDVSGIGRAQGQERHEVSQGRAALRGSAAGGFGARRYAFWGHNGAPSGEIATDSMPSGIQARLKRTWKFVSEGNINDMHIAYHLDSLAGNDPMALRLLVGTSGQNFLNQTLVLPGVINGDYIEFRHVTLSNGMLVTLGTSDLGVAPLPVELLHFNVQNQTDAAAISWATASETNNDFYTVLRSTDPGSDWEIILTTEGAGNSTTRTDYLGYDEQPLHGVSYYRLAQTDFDGKYEQFEIKSLHRKPKPGDFGMELFPNPGSDVVYVYSDRSLQGVSTVLYDMQGGEMHVIIELNDSHAKIGVNDLPVGVYILRCAFHDGLISMPFVVAR